MLSRVLAQSRGRVPARALGAVALALSSAVIAGCGTTTAGNSSVTVTGGTLRVYLSAPAGAASNPQVQDVVDAEQLAWAKHSKDVTAFRLELKPITASKLSDNGRTAITDTKAIAYVGEIVPGSSANSAGITDAQDLLQVAPTDTALELTQGTLALPGAPNSYYESISTYGKTFARVAPSSAAEAKAQVQAMQGLGVKRLYVGSDGSDYGKAIARAVQQAAPGAAIAVMPTASSTDDAVFYGSASPAAAARAFAAAAGANPSVKLFGPSGLDTPSLVSALGASPPRYLYISSPGFLPANLTPAGQQFVSDFKAMFGHTPALGAIFGYEAMSAVLGVIHEAGTGANNRQTVVRDFLSLKNPLSSVIGGYSIDPSGDISFDNSSLTPFVFSRLKAGALVPSAVRRAAG